MPNRSCPQAPASAEPFFQMAQNKRSDPKGINKFIICIMMILLSPHDTTPAAAPSRLKTNNVTQCKLRLITLRCTTLCARKCFIRKKAISMARQCCMSHFNGLEALKVVLIKGTNYRKIDNTLYRLISQFWLVLNNQPFIGFEETSLKLLVNSTFLCFYWTPYGWYIYQNGPNYESRTRLYGPCTAATAGFRTTSVNNFGVQIFFRIGTIFPLLSSNHSFVACGIR